MHSSISRKDFPALDDPEISILCPRRSTPWISSSGSTGGFAAKSDSGAMLGISSVAPST